MVHRSDAPLRPGWSGCAITQDHPRRVTPARILIVEDDRIVARDLAQQLTRMGHVVVGTTSRGEDALSRTLDTRADLVLMDIRLEGAVDGITAAQQIRDRCRIPVVFLTAYADDETTRRAGEAEPLGYLLKPFQEPQLLATIEMALYKNAADRRLRASEQRYETTLSSIGDGVISTDAAALVTFMNPIAERLTGWPQAEAIGRPLAEVFRIFDGRTGARLEAPATRALRDGAIVDLPPHTILRARDGRDIPIDDSSAPILAEDGQPAGTVLVFADRTGQRDAEVALRRAEAELARASRLTLLGEFAASIAHEVNQPLMAIVTNAESCLRWLGQDQPDIRRANDAAQRVVRNGHRAAEVIASLRALASNTSPRMLPLDLPAAIEDALVLLRAELERRAILLQTRFPEALPLVTGDRVQLQQVVANLVMNAIEAIGDAEPDAEARTILIELGLIELGSEAAGEVVVAVAGSGAGVDPGIAGRMFEPLVTTKPDGMGLGLSISRNIVEAHRGRIWSVARQPRGTIIRFTLPLDGNA